MKILAAMSGGVDSSVATARLVEAGYDVMGVHMTLWGDGSTGQDSQDAARIADILGIPFYEWDLREEFRAAVLDYFLDSYSNGWTPNPCVKCNEFIKYDALLRRGAAYGVEAMATGHYAQIVPTSRGFNLLRSANTKKDQSYVVASMGKRMLSRVMFPLGAIESKDMIRAEAQRRGLPVAHKKDSYDICFIPDRDTRGFLARNIGEKPGLILDMDGNTVGEHVGAFAYTIGQRRGLRLGRPAEDGQPRYVVSVEPQSNVVRVGTKEDLLVRRIDADHVIWLADDVPADDGADVFVQVRAHGRPIPARIVRTGDTLTAQLHADLLGLARGQAVVAYQGDRVLGVARVISTDALERLDGISGKTSGTSGEAVAGQPESHTMPDAERPSGAEVPESAHKAGAGSSLSGVLAGVQESSALHA
ncbi:MAG: tRNA 2-thiouridine(34) synthase MnmA [Actinomycetaceae bacterium]|nr:tRNA 2-thiouridine(34) synthase MnmA [Actinomycetaceae bacterium]